MVSYTQRMQRSMRYKFTFDNGEATVRLEKTLPLPAAPVEAPTVRGDTLRSPALDQIEALLPAVLSELVFGHTQPEESRKLA